MPRLGCSDVIVIGDPHPIPQSLERGRNLIRKLLGRNARGSSGALNLLAVLIGSREEERIVAQQTVTPCDHIRRNGCIGMPDVRARVDIVNRGSEIELLPGHGCQGSVYQAAAEQRYRATRRTCRNGLAPKLKLQKVETILSSKSV